MAARFGRVWDFLFPPACPSCGQLTAQVGLCGACVAAVRRIRSPMCLLCGLPYPGRGVDHRCHTCLRRQPRFERARACVLYDHSLDSVSPLAKVIHQYKYNRDVTLAPLLGSFLVQHCPMAVDHDVIVPVPLHRDRLRWRGFNQSLLLGKALAHRCHVRLDPFVLTRTRATVPQIELDAASRRRNIAGAFAVRRPDAVRGSAVLLLDDVYTTGATANECARELKRAGAARVDVLVLARAVLY